MIHKRKQYRRMQERRAKKNLKEIVNNSREWMFTIYEKDGKYINDGRGPRSKWLKRQSNKKNRRNKDIGSGGWYRKNYDYWWKLY